MTTPETEPQSEPPAGTLVENQGVNAGKEDVADSDASASDARKGGHPERAAEQLENSPGQDQMTDQDDSQDNGEDSSELTGAPDPRSEAGGQDSGSMD